MFMYNYILYRFSLSIRGSFQFTRVQVSEELYVFVSFPNPPTPPVSLSGDFLQDIRRHSIQTSRDCCLVSSTVRKRWLILTNVT